jgi:hypothetical protein
LGSWLFYHQSRLLEILQFFFSSFQYLVGRMVWSSFLRVPQNIFSACPPELTVKSWILIMWHRLTRYSTALCILTIYPYNTCWLVFFSFHSDTTEPPATSRNGNQIYFYPPRRTSYIGYNAPSISSVMQGPKINPSSDNLLLSTLKRKGGSSKVLTHRSKKRIDTKVVNISDMAGVLASAFQVMTLSLFSSFLYLWLTIPFCSPRDWLTNQNKPMLLFLIEVQYWSQFKKLQLMIPWSSLLNKLNQINI